MIFVIFVLSCLCSLWCLPSLMMPKPHRPHGIRTLDADACWCITVLKPGASSSGCQRGWPLVSSKSLSLEGVLSACSWPACFQGGNSGQCFLLEEWAPHASSFVKWVRIYHKGFSRHFLCSTHISLDLTISVHSDLTFYRQHLHFFSWGLVMLPKTVLLTSMAAGNESRD